MKDVTLQAQRVKEFLEEFSASNAFNSSVLMIAKDKALALDDLMVLAQHGALSSVDVALHALTTIQRDAAWRQVTEMRQRIDQLEASIEEFRSRQHHQGIAISQAIAVIGGVT